jgi:ATP-dependent RNA helicase RhlE
VLAGVKALGYTNPTPIQEKAIPVALEERDVLGLAQTGTGKTAGFMLPILQRLITGPRGSVRALIVVPTRELAEQIHQSAVDLGKGTRIRSTAVYGGVSKLPQVAALKRGAEIVVACPGRLLDHIAARTIDLSHVEVLVLDEADTMCDMGFLPEIRRILTHVPEKRQTLFFAATMPDEIRVLSKDILNDPTTVQIGIIAPAKTVSHALYPVTDALKKRLLFDLLEKTATGRVMIFTRTKHRTRRLARDLESARYRVAALQGNMSQNRRQESINGFRGGKYDLLVATDVASRGIDVSDVSHVINFDMPNTVDAYIHRIGRTGRMENSGEAFTLTLPEDEGMVRQVEAVLGTQIERRRLPDFDYGGFTPGVRASRSLPDHIERPQVAPNRNQPRRAPNAVAGRTGGLPPRHSQSRPDGQSNSNGYRSRRPRRRSPAPATDPAR